jgi:hypothetical protein
MSVRVLNFTGGLFPQKKGDINPPQNSENPLAPWGSIFRFFQSLFFCKFKKLSWGSETSDMTSKGLVVIFENLINLSSSFFSTPLLTYQKGLF